MPYTVDLVRLAASAFIAIDVAQLDIAHRDASTQVEAGVYTLHYKLVM